MRTNAPGDGRTLGRLAGGLWLALLVLPIAVLVLVESPDRGLGPVHWLALVAMTGLLIAMMSLAFNRPAGLTRLLTPQWLLSERERLFGPLGADGRPTRRRSTSC